MTAGCVLCGWELQPWEVSGHCEGCVDSLDMLRAAIEQSGLSVDKFARTVLVRDKSTLYRWLRGEVEVPAVVLEKLEALEG